MTLPQVANSKPQPIRVPKIWQPQSGLINEPFQVSLGGNGKGKPNKPFMYQRIKAQEVTQACHPWSENLDPSTVTSKMRNCQTLSPGEGGYYQNLTWKPIFNSNKQYHSIKRNLWPTLEEGKGTLRANKAWYLDIFIIDFPQCLDTLYKLQVGITWEASSLWVSQNCLSKLCFKIARTVKLY